MKSQQEQRNNSKWTLPFHVHIERVDFGIFRWNDKDGVETGEKEWIEGMRLTINSIYTHRVNVGKSLYIYLYRETQKERFSRKYTLCCASYQMGNDIRYTLTWEYGIV